MGRGRGRIEAGDSRQDSDLYYAPQRLVTLLALVRTRVHSPREPRSTPRRVSGRLATTARARAWLRGRASAWTQDWSTRWRTVMAAEYGQTPTYHRSSLNASFGYRF